MMSMVGLEDSCYKLIHLELSLLECCGLSVFGFTLLKLELTQHISLWPVNVFHIFTSLFINTNNIRKKKGKFWSSHFQAPFLWSNIQN